MNDRTKIPRTDNFLRQIYYDPSIEAVEEFCGQLETELTQWREMAEELAARLKITDYHVFKLVGKSAAFYVNQEALTKFNQLKNK